MTQGSIATAPSRSSASLAADVDPPACLTASSGSLRLSFVRRRLEERAERRAIVGETGRKPELRAPRLGRAAPEIPAVASRRETDLVEIDAQAQRRPRAQQCLHEHVNVVHLTVGGRLRVAPRKVNTCHSMLRTTGRGLTVRLAPSTATSQPMPAVAPRMSEVDRAQPKRPWTNGMAREIPEMDVLQRGRPFVARCDVANAQLQAIRAIPVLVVVTAWWRLEELSRIQTRPVPRTPHLLHTVDDASAGLPVHGAWPARRIAALNSTTATTAQILSRVIRGSRRSADSARQRAALACNAAKKRSIIILETEPRRR